MRDSSGKKSWSFISEDSFCGGSHSLQLDALPWDNHYPASESSDGDEIIDLANPTSLDLRHFQLEQEIQLGSAINQHDYPTSKRKRTVTFQESFVSDIPVVMMRKSSAPAPSIITLLQEDPRLASQRRRAATAPSVFNHTLYGSLRTGQSVDLFGREFSGLAFSAAATGFLVPFLQNCFHPLLVVYLSLSDDQAEATSRFLLLPGVMSFFIGILSDFYPLWSFHRKAYMVGGWVLAYCMLMALVIIAMVDDRTALLADNIRTFHGGVVYVLLMMAVSLGVTIASVAAFAFVVELSQREPIHERGTLVLQYLITREVFTLFAVIGTSQLMDYDHETEMTKSVISMKALLLLMAFVALAPIPAVLFRLDEEQRQIKVDAVDRSSLTHQMWNIVQQEAVWRILLFICAAFFLAYFQFDFVDDAVMYWSDVTPNVNRLGQIPYQTLIVVALITFRYTLLNYSWVRLSVASMVFGLSVHLAATIPVILDSVRYEWYYLAVQAFAGLSKGAMIIVTTLPVIEITENCIEGATTGLVESYRVIIDLVILTFSTAIGNASTSWETTFSTKALAADETSTRMQVLMFTMVNYAINLCALVPILYLLPAQKLDAQQMRTYGGYSRTAGVGVVLLFVGLVIFALTMNLLALVEES